MSFAQGMHRDVKCDPKPVLSNKYIWYSLILYYRPSILHLLEYKTGGHYTGVANISWLGPGTISCAEWISSYFTILFSCLASPDQGYQGQGMSAYPTRSCPELYSVHYTVRVQNVLVIQGSSQYKNPVEWAYDWLWGETTWHWEHTARLVRGRLY